MNTSVTCYDSSPSFIDLFAGAGGLSEGFIRAGYTPIAHVESDSAAANTLRTRSIFHALRKQENLEEYWRYLNREITRKQFYEKTNANDTDIVINQTIGKNTLNLIFDEIDKKLGKKKVDLIIGGPPCQAYSLVGRARSEQKMLGDDRNYLFLYYADFLKKYRPTYFVFENVVGLLSAKDYDGRKYLDLMMRVFKKAGYAVEWKILSADRYGVLQRRKRVILIGRRGSKTGFFPHLNPVELGYTVNDALRDLPSLKHGQGSPHVVSLKNDSSEWLKQARVRTSCGRTTWHQARPHNEQDLVIFSKAIQKWKKNERLSYKDLPDYLKSHSNQSSFLDRFKVVASNLHASHTIVAHIAKDGNYYIHPDEHQNRSLTPREAARLQTFPDDYFFEGVTDQPSRTATFRQIGNAVPVVLAHHVAEALKEYWI